MFKLWYDYAQASKVMFKILQPKLEQYVNQENSQADLERAGGGTSGQITNIHWVIKKGKTWKTSASIDYAKAFDYMNLKKLQKIVKEMGIPVHLTYLLRNLYADQEATVRFRQGKIDWFKIGIGVCQGCILPHCFVNLYAEYIFEMLD